MKALSNTTLIKRTLVFLIVASAMASSMVHAAWTDNQVSRVAWFTIYTDKKICIAWATPPSGCGGYLCTAPNAPQEFVSRSYGMAMAAKLSEQRLSFGYDRNSCGNGGRLEAFGMP